VIGHRVSVSFLITTRKQLPALPHATAPGVQTMASDQTGSTKRARNEGETPSFIFCDDLRGLPVTPAVKLEEIDLFFHRQAEVFSQYEADLPIVRIS
jgi:hypothetical protein